MTRFGHVSRDPKDLFVTKEHHRRWKPSTAQNQQQQEKIESILFFFAERKQKVAVNFKDI